MDIAFASAEIVVDRLSREAFGMIGGALFLSSWILQAWESNRNNSPIVSIRFFILRALGSGLLILESIRLGSISLGLVTGGTLLIVLYNIGLILKSDRPNDI